MDELEKLKKGLVLPVMEEFYSLQGEGFHTGKPAYFIRLGGCDVGCSWCDVKESWRADTHSLTSVEEVVNRVLSIPAKAVVVTGGEPLCYDLGFLCSELKKSGIKTHLETSGSQPLTGQWDWLCLSPKYSSPPLDDFYNMADELKVIIQRKEDFAWAENNSAKVSSKCHLYLQPEWSVHLKIMPVIVEYILQHPEWRISLQSHKYMQIP